MAQLFAYNVFLLFFPPMTPPESSQPLSFTPFLSHILQNKTLKIKTDKHNKTKKNPIRQKMPKQKVHKTNEKFIFAGQLFLNTGLLRSVVAMPSGVSLEEKDKLLDFRVSESHVRLDNG